MPAPPLVTAVIIFLDERRFLAEAIDSVRAQTLANWELLLVDDGSTDGSSEIARRAAEADSRVICLEHSGHANRGMSASRNLGLSHARGEFIAFLDGDDVWLPEKLERQVAILSAHPAVDFVYGNTLFWYGWSGDSRDAARDTLRGIGMIGDEVVRPPNLMKRCFPLGLAPSAATCSMLLRRAVVEKVGGYEEAFRGIFEDQALLAKLYLNATAFVSRECHDRYRMHAESCVSRSTAAGRNEEATHAFLEWLDRYTRTHPAADEAIRASIRRALWPGRHPWLHRLSTRVRAAATSTRFRSWRGTNQVLRRFLGKSTGSIRAAPNPILSSDRFATGATRLTWAAAGAGTVEVRLDAPDGELVCRSGSTGSADDHLIVEEAHFYLQDVTDERPLVLGNTLDAERVRVRPVIQPRALTDHEMPPGREYTPPQVDRGVGGRRTSECGRAIVLLYHRVAEVVGDPWRLAVSPINFAAQMEAARAFGPVISLGELRDAMTAGRVIDRSVCVTFDDGYADNLWHAKPILERYEVPATVFVTTAAVSSAREFWWDELERICLRTDRLPRSLELETAGRQFTFALGDDASFSPHTRQQHRRWRAWGDPAPTKRHELYLALYEVLYPLSAEERLAIQNRLLAWAALPEQPSETDRRTLTSGELQRLFDGLVEAGAHCVTHPLLAAMAIDRQRAEIEDSRKALSTWLARPIDTFAYPFGKRGDYSDETIAAVRGLGFTAACANFSGLVQRHTDLFQLPRAFMGDWTSHEFSQRLAAWFAE